MSSTLECKICGGIIVPDKNGITGKCESCGTVTVIPKSETNSSKLNRANYLRRANEFDKAMALFEEIVKENDEDSEAYWGLVLCKYGIEYVDDVDGSKKPTCHRTMFNSILDDPDYKAAIDNALGAVRYIYEDEAKIIDEIQKKIKSIAANEKPYDIFICYKESDEQGQRTRDSVDAQEIYNRLTSKGYKVFFARKTLQNKLGSEYEPLIFAALSSAKIMLVYGSKPEFFDAVWVKNEWSRFRRMMAENKDKKIIPIYDGSQMSAYDLPNELVDFQAFDKYRVGFMEDLIDGLEKMMKKNKAPERPVYTAAADDGTKGLMDRAELFLEDNMWDKADEYYEKVLDKNPRLSAAYIGKLLVNYKLKSIDELETLTPESQLEDNDNYKKALQFADNELFDRLVYISMCPKYNRACDNLAYTSDVYKLRQLKEIFQEFKGFKASEEKIAECDRKIEEYYENEKYKEYNNAVINFSRNSFELAKKQFAALEDYKDSAEYIKRCDEGIKESKYSQLVDSVNSYHIKEEYREFAERLKEFGNYKNSREMIEKCYKKIEELENNEKRIKRKKAIVASAIAGVILIIIIFAVLKSPANMANMVNYYIEYEKYEKAYDIALNYDIANRSNILSVCQEGMYAQAFPLFAEGKYEEAQALFEKIGEYKDAPKQIDVCREARYRQGFQLFEEGKYNKAKKVFEALGDYKDASAQIPVCENAKKKK